MQNRNILTLDLDSTHLITLGIYFVWFQSLEGKLQVFN